MARLMEPTDAELTRHNHWLDSLPQNVWRIAERFDPWSLYRLKETGERVTLYAFHVGCAPQSPTFIVEVLGKYNRCTSDRKVFGVMPDKLEPCEPPGPDEELGATP